MSGKLHHCVWPFSPVTLFMSFQIVHELISDTYSRRMCDVALLVNTAETSAAVLLYTPAATAKSWSAAVFFMPPLSPALSAINAIWSRAVVSHHKISPAGAAPASGEVKHELQYLPVLQQSQQRYLYTAKLRKASSHRLKD